MFSGKPMSRKSVYHKSVIFKSIGGTLICFPEEYASRKSINFEKREKCHLLEHREDQARRKPWPAEEVIFKHKGCVFLWRICLPQNSMLRT